MNNTFGPYKGTTYENNTMTLKIDDVFSDIIYISIYTRGQTPDKLSLSLKGTVVQESNSVVLKSSICTSNVSPSSGLCSLIITYDILEKSFTVPGIYGIFILKNVPGRPNERSPVTFMSGYTQFPSPSPSPSGQSPSAASQPRAIIKSTVPFANFITVTFSVMNTTDWKLDLIDKSSDRVVNTFKNTVRLNNSNEENRRTFQNVQEGVYIAKLIPYSSNNMPGVESTSNEIVIGVDTRRPSISPSSSPITGYTQFPSTGTTTSPSPRSSTNTTTTIPSPRPSSNLLSTLTTTTSSPMTPIK